MKRCVETTVGAVLICLAAAPALALGPVDGEVGVIYWANEYDSSGGTTVLDSVDSAAPGFRAELWLLDRYGIRAGMYGSDLDDLDMESSEQMSVDLLWRAFSPTSNNFFAVGAGWQETDLSTIGLDGDTSGARVGVEGRVSAGVVYFYGQGSYFPSLKDAESSSGVDGRFEEMEGHEYEVGVSWKMMPFVSLRAGYRVHSVDFVRTDFDLLGTTVAGNAETAGYLAGLTVRF